jgi:hypothetical protein
VGPIACVARRSVINTVIVMVNAGPKRREVGAPCGRDGDVAVSSR